MGKIILVHVNRLHVNRLHVNKLHRKGIKLMEIVFERADVNDAENLIKIRNQCFYSDYIKYGECPGYNMSLESMKNSIESGISYKIICDNWIIGNISIRDNQDHTYYLACLCVVPEFENKGIGRTAIHFIENEYSDAVLWTLVTPSDKYRNHYFYQKSGYKMVKEYMDGLVKVVMFEKRMPICGEDINFNTR
jgi:ribosomal protein S18 acetylase RimI-like enzyme